MTAPKSIFANCPDNARSVVVFRADTHGHLFDCPSISDAMKKLTGKSRSPGSIVGHKRVDGSPRTMTATKLGGIKVYIKYKD